jgi:capsular exopolysaccharide synthesis family protein
MRAAGVSAGADDPSEALRGQLLYARQQVRDARQRYLPEHPTVVAAEANVAALVAQVEQEARGAAESYVTLLGQRAEQAAQREESLRRSIEEQRQRAARARQRDAERARVDADAQRTEQLLADVTQRIETFKLGKTVAPSVDVVEPPSTPTAPIRPHTFRLLMAGLLGGLGLGAGLGLVVDKTDQRLRSVEDIRVTVGVPILGTMPRLPSGGAAGSVGRNADLEPGSEFSESCRAIRTALFFGSQDVQARTILVTSPTPGEGKSTLASNLAISIARAGKRVLLVDADMRRPVQHRVFESAPDCDFPSLLAGGGDIGAMCVKTGIMNLDILACGSIPHNPSELLNSRAFTELLEELTIRYDHVVLDSPPVTAVADAQILAAASSATILVIRADHSTRGATVRAREALAHVGARVLGAVVNDVREKGDRYGRYGYTGEYKRTPDELKQLPPGKMAG